MANWSIDFCEIPFEKDNTLGRAHLVLRRPLPSHTFWRLSDPDNNVQEIHGAAFCEKELISWGDDPKILVKDMLRSDKKSLFRLSAHAYSSRVYDEEKVAASRVMEGGICDILLHWNAALRFVHDVNTTLPRYHLLRNNCNTLTGAIRNVLGVPHVKGTDQAVGFSKSLRYGPDNACKRYFNSASGASAEVLQQERQILSDDINSVGGRVVYIGAISSEEPITMGEELSLVMGGIPLSLS